MSQRTPKGPADAWDEERIRADFPVLSRRMGEKPLVYLDTAASAQKPGAMMEAVERAYMREYANVHRGAYRLTNEATARYEAARGTVRRFLGAQDACEVIFTRNATEAINLVAASFGREFIGEGDEIIVSLLEHHANIVPWHFLRERSGAALKWIPVDDDGQLIVEEYEKLFTARTKIVAVTHMSNALGTIPPVEEIVRIAHDHGVPVLVDGSQAAAHFPVNVRELGADFYVFTGHKAYGPSGVGVLCGRREWLEKLPPFLGGGEMISSVTRDKVEYAPLPYRLEAGTPPIVQAIGLGAALEYMESTGRQAIAAHGAALLAYARERLRETPGVRIIGAPQRQGALLSFVMEGAHPADVATLVDQEGVALRAGSHCAQPIMERMGVPGTCRVSFGMYNTFAEIDHLVAALEKIRKLFI